MEKKNKFNQLVNSPCPAVEISFIDNTKRFKGNTQQKRTSPEYSSLESASK